MASRLLVNKLKRIKILLLDVDGVLTDGGIYYSADGVELKRFNAHDGYGIALAMDAGVTVGLVSGRKTSVVTKRARELKISEVHQGASDKVAVMRGMQARLGFRDEEVAFMGDDLFDLPLLGAVGLSVAPQNARTEVKRKVDLVTETAGGEGAVRELIDLILKFK